MPKFTYQDIYGTNLYTAFYADSEPPYTDYHELVIELNDFQDLDNGGEILGGVGLSDLQTNAAAYEFEWLQETPNYNAAKIFYGQVLLIMQAQAESINADPEQEIYINKLTPSLATGARQGQTKHDFLVSFFIDSNIQTLVNIDSIFN